MCEGELTTYPSFTQMACVYVSQLKHMCCLPYWFVSYCHFTIVQLFQYGGGFAKACVQFNYEHLVSIIEIFWYSIQKKYHP